MQPQKNKEKNMNKAKYVLVTGAFGGMGKAAVKQLRNEGFFVFALDKRVGEAADGVIPIECDVADEASVEAAFERVKSVTDELFAVVHYAGIYMLDSLVEMTAQAFERIFKINLFGAFLINKGAMPLLKKGSRIVMVTSELAPLDPLPFTGIYGVSKSALDKYAFSLRMELQLLDISVSVIRAGAVKTDMLGASVSALDGFCARTALYECNSKRFKQIVDSVESKSVPPEKIARKTVAVLKAKSPKFAYSVNANFLLKLLNVLPDGIQFAVIKKILK